MLTDAVDAIDAAPGLWMSVSEIARKKGVSKQAIAKRVERLVGDGLIETRIGAQNAKLVNIAAYDRAVGETTDAVRSANGRQSLSGASDPVLAQEQAKKTAYQAELARLDLDERTGKLMPVEDVLAAIGACAESIVRTLEQLPQRADEIASAVARDGAHGARAALRDIGFDLRKSIERALRTLAEANRAAPAPEAPAAAA